MKAGDLKHRITINTVTRSTDALGQENEATPSHFATVWAAKLQLTSKDIAKQAGTQEQSEIKLLIRYLADITTAMTVVFRGRTYAINGTEEYADREGLFLFVRSVNG